MGTRDLEPLRDGAPSATFPEVLRLTSLFGGSWAWLSEGFERIGAAEPCDIASDGESGPMLDLGLLFWDIGMVESRLIHEPLDETESRLESSPALLRSEPKSPFRTNESCLPREVLKESNLVLEGREVPSRGEGAAGEVPREGSCVSGVVMVELVAGRDGGRKTPLTSTREPTFLFFDVGRGGVAGSGRARARPVAATPMVLDATSYTTMVSTHNS